MFPTRRINYPGAWTSYPNFAPATTSASVYGNNQVIYPFDIPYTSAHSRATGDFVATRPRLNQPRYCAYSCDNPARIDVIKAVAGINDARHF